MPAFTAFTSLMLKPVGWNLGLLGVCLSLIDQKDVAKEGKAGVSLLVFKKE